MAVVGVKYLQDILIIKTFSISHFVSFMFMKTEIILCKFQVLRHWRIVQETIKRAFRDQQIAIFEFIAIYFCLIQYINKIGSSPSSISCAAIKYSHDMDYINKNVNKNCLLK